MASRTVNCVHAVRKKGVCTGEARQRACSAWAMCAQAATRQGTLARRLDEFGRLPTAVTKDCLTWGRQRSRPLPRFCSGPVSVCRDKAHDRSSFEKETARHGLMICTWLRWFRDLVHEDSATTTQVVRQRFWPGHFCDKRLAQIKKKSKTCCQSLPRYHGSHATAVMSACPQGDRPTRCNMGVTARA
jgi:hypothetical protein